MLTAEWLGMGSNPREGMNIRKRIMPAAWGALHSRRAAIPFVILVGEEERWKALDYPHTVVPQSWGGT
ncbi:hypothetical protein TNCV_2766881 [Trichonephila clavipes]|nr:hypothetical protein TNCV_2766881 [Trichonephila clavipes]